MPVPIFGSIQDELVFLQHRSILANKMKMRLLLHCHISRLHQISQAAAGYNVGGNEVAFLAVGECAMGSFITLTMLPEEGVHGGV